MVCLKVDLMARLLVDEKGSGKVEWLVDLLAALLVGSSVGMLAGLTAVKLGVLKVENLENALVAQKVVQ